MLRTNIDRMAPGARALPRVEAQRRVGDALVPAMIVVTQDEPSAVEIDVMVEEPHGMAGSRSGTGFVCVPAHLHRGGACRPRLPGQRRRLHNGRALLALDHRRRQARPVGSRRRHNMPCRRGG